jgi:hypothetical protein
MKKKKASQWEVTPYTKVLFALLVLSFAVLVTFLKK